MDNAKLVVISGPSGVGKSTLLSKLFAKYGDKLDFSVSYTSRKPRSGESDGRDYYFITAEVFKKMIEENAFVEWAEVHGNYYGTSKGEIGRIVNAGKHCILDIDVQGAMQVKEKNVEAFFIFIAPESIEVLRERLCRRGTDSAEVIEKRLKNAEKELTYKEKYDYIIVNDNVEEAYIKMESCIFENI